MPIKILTLVDIHGCVCKVKVPPLGHLISLLSSVLFLKEGCMKQKTMSEEAYAVLYMSQNCLSNVHKQKNGSYRVNASHHRMHLRQHQKSAFTGGWSVIRFLSHTKLYFFEWGLRWIICAMRILHYKQKSSLFIQLYEAGLLVSEVWVRQKGFVGNCQLLHRSLPIPCSN